MKLTLLLIALTCTGCYTEPAKPHYAKMETEDADIKLYEIQTSGAPPVYVLFDMKSKRQYYGVKHVGFVEVKTQPTP